MAFVLSNIASKCNVKALEEKFLALSLQSNKYIQIREKKVMPPTPKLRHPTWFTRKTRTIHNDLVVPENRAFLKEVIEDKYPGGIDPSSPLFANGIVPAMGVSGEWSPELRRTGLIARKIGCYPMWLKDGTKIHTTLLQVLDNHVIKYFSPGEYDPPRKRPVRLQNPKACLLLGAEATDPSLLTKEYCGLFKNSGVMPKKHLARFFISPSAALAPGTPLNALHFHVGDYVDVRGNTVDRGFQGVMKKHGFKGMPASHGVTKTHRRGGNIGGGGEKGRVWPGTKMPGHMGNRYRLAKGLRIWRINTKHNVLYVQGLGVAGETNSIVYVYDTILPRRKPKQALEFPTYFAGKDDREIPEDIYDEDVHVFGTPSVFYDEVK